MTVPAARPFQACGSCKHAWPTQESFLVDPAVRLIGFQAVAHHPDLNLLVFEHRCGSSISILTPRLRNLLPGSGPHETGGRLLGTGECRGHCRTVQDLAVCDAPCSAARDRELIRIVLRMREQAASR